MLPVASVLVLLLLVGVYMRLPGRPDFAGEPVVPRLRVAGRMLVAAGCTALGLIVSLLLDTGVAGAFVFLMIYSIASVPALLGGLGALLAGRALTQGMWGARLPAVLGALVLAPAAAFWAYFFWSLEPTEWAVLLATRPRMQTVAVLSATSGVLALGGVLALLGLSRPAAPPPAPDAVGPAAAVSGTRGTLLRVGAGVAVVAALLAGLWMNQPRLTLGDSQPRQTCDEVARGVASHLEALDPGSVRPPVLPAGAVVGTGLVRDVPGPTPVALGAPPPPSTWNGHPSAVVVQRLRVEEAQAAEGQIREVVGQAGMASDEAGFFAVNGDISSLTVPYQGRGVTGSAQWQRCKGGSVIVLAQEVRPDRTGVCADPARQPRCVRLYAAAGPLLELARTSRSPAAKNEDPAFALRGRQLAVSVVVGTEMPRTLLGLNIDDAMEGWKPVRPGPACTANQICPVEPTLGAFNWSDGGPVVGVFRRGRMTARVEVVPGPGQLTTLRAIVSER